MIAARAAVALVNWLVVPGDRPDIFVTLPARIIVRIGPLVHDRFAVLAREKPGLHGAAWRLDRAVTSAAFWAGKEYNEVAYHHRGLWRLCAPMSPRTYTEPGLPPAPLPYYDPRMQVLRSYAKNLGFCARAGAVSSHRTGR
jgi:hypothetical protein